MCKQAKTGFMDCPHVFKDDDIERCENATGSFSARKICKDVEIYWHLFRVPGKCQWCQEREDPSKETKKTWCGGKVKRRPAWLM